MRIWVLAGVVLSVSCTKQAEVAPAPKPDAVAQQAALSPVSVNGQAFVVTRGRENIKLALVEVNAIPRTAIETYIAERQKLGADEVRAIRPALDAAKVEWRQAEKGHEAADAKYLESSSVTADNFSTETDKWLAAGERARQKKATWMKINKQFQSFSEPAYYFAALPSSVASAKTDADGRFAINVPPGKYVLAAATSRKIFRDTENYFWLVEVDASKPINGLMLSNDNEISTKCKECIRLPE